MSANPAPKVRDSTAGRIRQKVAAAPEGTFFHVRDLQGTSRAVESAVSRLSLDGTLVRVHKGLYWKPEDNPFGPSEPDPLEVAFEVGRLKGPGPAAETAAAFLGLRDWPSDLEVAVVGEPPTNVARVTFVSRANARRVLLGSHAVALLEVLRGWPSVAAGADYDTLLRTARELTDRGDVDMGLLRKVAEGEATELRNAVASLSRQL